MLAMLLQCNNDGIYEEAYFHTLNCKTEVFDLSENCFAKLIAVCIKSQELCGIRGSTGQASCVIGSPPVLFSWSVCAVRRRGDFRTLR